MSNHAHDNKIRRFDWTNLSPQDGGAFAGFQTRQERSLYWEQFSAIQMTLQSMLYQTIAEIPELSKLRIKELVRLKLSEITALCISEELASRVIENIKITINSADEMIAQQFLNQDPLNRERLMKAMRSDPEWPLIAFEEEDFFDNFPPAWQPVDMFQQSFARLFVEYQDNWRRNQMKEWQNSKGCNYRVLSEIEFAKRYGEPPWDFVNSIFKIASLDFRINSPNAIDDRPFDPTLEDSITGARIKFADLSSGEKVLMSFAFCLYYGKDNRHIEGYPKVILFDEIDAPLHPSMTKSLLRTIQTILVDQRKIKVIFTTHSPTTVALSPEESIYVMRKTGLNRIEKTSKDYALGVLMTGVPTLSLSYENRRQIFVESQYDVLYYGKIYEKLRLRLIPEISLNFIASGRTGGCANVRDLVCKLREAGNRSVFGIIDWDLQNKPASGVFVLGAHERYSIENFVLDPLLLAILLFLERFISREDIGLAPHETHIDFATLGRERLQLAANFVVDRVRPHIENSSDNKLNISRTVGNIEISIPSWYCMTQGHTLEAAIRSAFPRLRAFHGEAQLKNAIIERVADDLPTLLPAAFERVFSEIQTG
jgi:energy-coupling factor transporter ATP-binding protein EcfA2